MQVSSIIEIGYLPDFLDIQSPLLRHSLTSQTLKRDNCHELQVIAVKSGITATTSMYVWLCVCVCVGVCSMRTQANC